MKKLPPETGGRYKTNFIFSSVYLTGSSSHFTFSCFFALLIKLLDLKSDGYLTEFLYCYLTGFLIAHLGNSIFAHLGNLFSKHRKFIQSFYFLPLSRHIGFKFF